MAVKKPDQAYLDELYASFRVKNISRTEFKRRYLAATDPRGIRRDLETIQLRRQLSGKVQGL